MRDVKGIGQAAGGLVAQTLLQVADGDYAVSYIGIGRTSPGAKLELVMFGDGGLDAAKAWITKKDKVDAVVVGLDEADREVRVLLGSTDATRKYDMICSVRYEVRDNTVVKKGAKGKGKGGGSAALVQTSTIGFLAETDDDEMADDFLDSVLAGIYGHARAKDLAVGELGEYDDLE